MDKNLRVQVLNIYNRYVNAIVEAAMDTINICVAYPLLILEKNQWQC